MIEYQAKILIVDDSSENLKLLGNSLKRESYNVLTALNGKQALALAESKDPDLILLDVMMPEMNGYEVFERLLSSQKTSGTPVIFVSALGRPEDIKAGLEMGAADYVVKPFNFEQLHLRISKQLELKRRFDFTDKLAKTNEFLLRELLSEKKHSYSNKNVKRTAKPKDQSINSVVAKFLQGKFDHLQMLQSTFKPNDLDIFLREQFHTDLNDEETQEIKTPDLNYTGFVLIQALLASFSDLMNVSKVSIVKIERRISSLINEMDLLQIRVSYQGSIDDFEQIVDQLSSNFTIGSKDPEFMTKMVGKFMQLTGAKIKRSEKGNSILLEIPIHKAREINSGGRTGLFAKKDLSKNKIMIVEDNELNVEYLTSLLLQFNLQFDLAKTGEEAVGLANIKNYNLILMDINLPDISGLEVTKMLRKKYKCKTPIVSISGHNDKAIILKCLESGFNAFLTKPFNLKDMENILMKYLVPAIDKEQIMDTSPVEKSGKIREYSYSKATELANGNVELLKEWLNKFCEVLDKASSAIKILKETQEYKGGVKPFHDLVNYSGYFRINNIIDCITRIQKLNKEIPGSNSEFQKYLDALEKEIAGAKGYYLKVLQNI